MTPAPSFTLITHDQFLGHLCTAIGRTARGGAAFLFGCESVTDGQINLAIVTDAGRFRAVTSIGVGRATGRRGGYINQDRALELIRAYLATYMRQIEQAVEAGKALTSAEAEALRRWTEIRTDGDVP